jgi:hypothetical protein
MRLSIPRGPGGRDTLASSIQTTERLCTPAQARDMSNSHGLAGTECMEARF